MRCVDVPQLSHLELRNAFQKVDSVVIENAGLLEEKLRTGVVIHSQSEWDEASNFIGSLTVASNSCNGYYFSELDYSHIQFLRELLIGDECLHCVEELRLCGLERLEKVVIGKKSLCTRNGCFECVNCEQLKTLKIGNESCGVWNRFVVMNCGVSEIRVGDECFVNCEFVSLVSACAGGE